MFKKKIVLYSLVFLLVGIVGCSKEELSTDKERNIDFTVLEQSEVPVKLAERIAEKKEKGFKITYVEEDYMYLAIGYGKQSTGGYSVSVKELYSTKNSICIKTSLIGPNENDMVLKAITYPYLVLKFEKIDKDVIWK